MTTLSITSTGGLSNQGSQTITGTGNVGASVTILDGSSILGTAIVGSNGNWTSNVSFSAQGAHSITAQVSAPSVFTTLVTFVGTDGLHPKAGLTLDAAGNLYGTTYLGGASGNGTIFELSGPNYQTLTTLVSFNGTNGANPSAGLTLDSAGNLYGTTQRGGTSGYGTIYELSGPNHETLTTLASFNNTNGAYPDADLTLDAAGNLYGTTQYGGAGGVGTIFKLSGADHQTLTTLASFNKTNGAYPSADLTIDAAGNLYGTTYSGGVGGYGTVFALSGPNHQTLTTLVNFDGTNGATPYASLTLDAMGNLYGTTNAGGYLYGTTTPGGASGYGTVFELSGPDHQTLTTLFSFNGANGGKPQAGLTLDAAGNLYGTTYSGGVGGYGTVFKLSGANHQTMTTLVSFNGINGRVLVADLTLDAAGNLFGTTFGKSSTNGTWPNDKGSVFELTLPSLTSAAVSYDLDSIAPTITQVSETSSNTQSISLAKAGDVITENFTATDTVTSVTIDGQAATVVHGTGDNYTATYTVQAGDSNGLAAVVITAVDAAGNSTTINPTATVTIDTVAPTVAAVSGLSNNMTTTLAIAGDVITETFTSTDTVTSVTIGGQVATVVHGTDDNYTATYTVQAGDSNGLAAVVITAKNAAGNSTTINPTATVTIDTVAPTVIITSASGATYQANQTISGTGEAGTTITLLDGSTVIGTSTVASNGNWSDAVTLSGYGTHTITATDVDAAGNVGTSSADIFNLFHSVAITSSGGLTNQVNQTITGTGEVGELVTILDGSTILGTTIIDSTGNWSSNVSFSAQGAHSITAQVTAPSMVTTLINFNGSNGWTPTAGLTPDAAGNLYGTTIYGGAGGSGTVFELSGPNHQTLTTLVSFDGGNGSMPFADLKIDAAGNLYGTTLFGGANGLGTVFELSGPNHQTLTTLVTFDGSNGLMPFAGLTLDTAGNLYGTTLYGGANNQGSVFELSGPNHQTLTTLVSFDGTNGWYPSATLTLDAAGNLYGTTQFGGASGKGTAFVLSGPDHQTLTTLVSFDGSNGAYPTAILTLDAAGNLYGTTRGGGASDKGTVFELSGTNHQTLTTLVSFNATNGEDPAASLTLDAAGNLYGTTHLGGASDKGTVFELSGPNHQTLTTLFSFNGSNGGYPLANLKLDAAGNLYGTTAEGGANGNGTGFALSLPTLLTTAAVSYDIDSIAPTITQVAETSNNTQSILLAKTGDVITETFTATDTVTSVTINGQAATVVHGVGDNYTATYTVQAGATRGLAEVVIMAQDLAGNSTTSTIAGTVMIQTPGVAAALTSDTPILTRAFWSDLLAGASDGGTGYPLNVTGLTYSVNGGAPISTAPAGIQFINNQLLVDPNNLAFRSFTSGQSATIVASYNITDGHGGSVAQTDTITISGPPIDSSILTNHAPTISAALTATASEGSHSFLVNLLSGAADIDVSNHLSVTGLSYTVNGGASSSIAPTGIQFVNNQLLVDPNNAAFSGLATGQSAIILASYNITDGHGGSVAQTETITITGSSSAIVVAPVTPNAISVTAALQSTATSGTQGFWSNLLAGSTDSNPNAHLSVANLMFSVDGGAASATAPTGIQYANNALMIDPNNATFRGLSTGQSETIVAYYDIIDGLGNSVAQTDTIIINGSSSQTGNSGNSNTPTPGNHAPELSAPVIANAGIRSSAFWSNMLDGATDVDAGNQLHVSNVLFSINGSSASSAMPTGIQMANDQLLVDPNSSAFNHLGVGESDTIVASYDIIDGHGGTVAQTHTVTIKGPAVTFINGAMVGTANNDILMGSLDNDIIVSGLGNDTLTGRAGADTFVFNFAANATTNLDTITDFVSGTDVLQFSKSIFKAIGAIGTLTDDQFYAADGATTANSATNHLVYNTTSGALYYDADGNGAGSAIQVAIIGSTIHPTLVAADIHIGL